MGLLYENAESNRSSNLKFSVFEIWKTFDCLLDLTWRTANFKIGDIAIFGLDLLHLTCKNMTNSFRLSCHTRWQPADDDVDPRVGTVNVL